MNGPPKKAHPLFHFCSKHLGFPEIFYLPSELYRNSYEFNLKGSTNISAEIINPPQF